MSPEQFLYAIWQKNGEQMDGFVEVGSIGLQNGMDLETTDRMMGTLEAMKYAARATEYGGPLQVLLLPAGVARCRQLKMR